MCSSFISSQTAKRSSRAASLLRHAGNLLFRRSGHATLPQRNDEDDTISHRRSKAENDTLCRGCRGTWRGTEQKREPLSRTKGSPFCMCPTRGSLTGGVDERSRYLWQKATLPFQKGHATFGERPRSLFRKTTELLFRSNSALNALPTTRSNCPKSPQKRRIELFMNNVRQPDTNRI